MMCTHDQLMGPKVYIFLIFIVYLFHVYYSEVLVAACEGKSMLLFDPISMKHIGTVPNAHTDCINTFR